MMRLSRTVLLLALALTAGARAAAAQTIPSPYDYIDKSQAAGLYVGYLFTDPDVGLPDSTTLPLAPQSGPVFGVRYQIRAAGPLTIDASLGVSPTERKLFAAELDADSVFLGPQDLETTVPSTVVMADLGLRFYLTGPRTWNGLAPFVIGMGGVAGDARGSFAEEDEVSDDARFRFGPSFAVGAGLGTDWFPVPNASLRVEATGRLWRVNTPSAFLELRTDEHSEWNPVLGITVGGAIHF
jgi:opacity protein-like surface antigen